MLMLKQIRINSKLAVCFFCCCRKGNKIKNKTKFANLFTRMSI